MASVPVAAATVALVVLAVLEKLCVTLAHRIIMQ